MSTSKPTLADKAVQTFKPHMPHKPGIKQRSLLIVLLLSPASAYNKPKVLSRCHLMKRSSCKYIQVLHVTKQDTLHLHVGRCPTTAGAHQKGEDQGKLGTTKDMQQKNVQQKAL